ncbi:MAG: hypothetical protein JWR44_2571 [Hymenobacter sp.]|jgi:gliding motility-associated-like protein|nr:hypothetical protein [Hymenobacter sp.]
MKSFLRFNQSSGLALALLMSTAATRMASAAPQPRAPKLSFVANRGQWPTAVQYRAEVPGGTVFLTPTGLVYDWHRPNDSELAHVALEAPAHHVTTASALRQTHAVFVDFVGAQAAALVGEERQTAYHNYFLGTDPRHWATQVPLFGAVRYGALYPGTDVRYYSTAEGQLEYDFLLKPGANPATVAMRYRGASGLQLRADGTLLVRTSVGEVHEQRPVAYQTAPNGKRLPVACRYALSDNTVRFVLPAGYNHALPLVIDPVVDACSYSGSRSSVFGTTTTYDLAGNIYSGGQVQAAGFPTSPGAAQSLYGGSTDVGIAKFNRTGTSLLYTTYLGGFSGDLVLAMATTAAGELCVLTSTGSTNFPLTPGCYNATSNPSTHLAITKLNASGTALVGSTLLDASFATSGSEIATSSTGGVFVLGSTSNSGFPTTTSAYSRTLRGGQDAFITYFNPTLTALTWSTLLGGNGQETPRSLAITTNNEPVIAGGTFSLDFPLTAGALMSNGSSFITRLRSDGTGLQASTYFGATTVNKVSLDGNGAPIVSGTNGTSTTSFPVPTPGALNVGGGSFVTGLSPDLRTISFSARLPPITLSAFGTDDCGRIFLAGFGSVPLPVLNPLPGSAAGGVFAVTLDVGATRALFSSGFGPGGSHTHSTTHRYDRNGRLYMSACDASGSFPATPGAAVPIKQVTSGGFDMATFVINQSTGGGSAGFLRAGIAAPDSSCAPFRLGFANTSVGASRYRWSFGDGTAADTARNPSHTFTAPGTYRVRLVATRNPGVCQPVATSDSVFVSVRVLSFPARVLANEQAPLCGGGSVVLEAAAGRGYTYRWNTGATTRSVVAREPGLYRVQVSNGRCETRDSVLIKAAVTLASLPNVITPNGDTQNELFKPSALTAGTALRIFNRWGTLVFQTDNYQNDWGTTAPAGLYYYVVENEQFCERRIKGWVEVIR